MSDDTNRTKVLVIEDEFAIAKLVRYVLENSGFEVSLAHEGKEALDLIINEPPDIIILDLMLPVMSGFEVLEHMESNGQLKTIPVIVLTCRGQEEDKVKAMHLGASEFMTKPFSPSGLVAVINSVLNSGGSIHG